MAAPSFTDFAQQQSAPSFSQFASSGQAPNPEQTPQIEPSDRLGAPITTPYDGMIREAAGRYHVDYKLAHSVMQAESSGDPHALSPAGAYGLYQLMPGFGPARKDVAHNIDLGVRYLGTLLNDFKGNVQKALAAYNAGPGAVEKYGGIPPFKETIDYISGIEGLLNYAQGHNYKRAAKVIAKTTPTAQPQRPQLQQAGIGNVFSGYMDFLRRVATHPMTTMSDAEAAFMGHPQNIMADIFGGARNRERMTQEEHGEETALNRLDEAAQALTYEPINALQRDMVRKGFKALGDELKTGSSGPEGDKYNQIWYNPKLTFGQKLDLVADEYGFNSPGELKYWSEQHPEKIASATPATPAGSMLQLGLSLHANLARMKLQHPWATGAETFGSTLLNPGYGAPGLAVKTAKLLRFMPVTLDSLKAAAKSGKYSSTVETVERKAEQFFRSMSRYTPIIGSRFYNMGQKFGVTGFAAHSMLANRIMGRSREMADIVMSNKGLKGLTPDQQAEVMHLLENPRFPRIVDPRDGHVMSDTEMLGQGYRPHHVDGEDTLIGPYTLRQRAEFLRAQQEKLEQQVVLKDPSQQTKFIFSTIGQDHGLEPTQTSQFAPHRGAFELPTNVGAHESPVAAATRRSSLHPVPGPHRNIATLEEGLWGQQRFLASQIPDPLIESKGLDLRKSWMPSAEITRHWTAMQRYLDVLDWLGDLRDAKVTSSRGEEAVKELKYEWDNPYSGKHEVIGVGRDGHKKATDLVGDIVNKAIQVDAAKGAFDIPNLPEIYRARALKNPAMAAQDYEGALRTKYEADLWRRIETGTLGENHDYEFRPNEVLSMDPLKGYALHRDVLDAIIDSHPALSKKYLELSKGARPGQRIDVGESWVDDDWESQNLWWDWFENVNDFVRQGIISNFFYHPFFNLIPNAMVKLKLPPQRVFRAMMGATPAHMMDYARKINATSPTFGRPVFTNPEHLHYILGVPFQDIWKRAAGQGFWAHAQAAADIGTKAYLWGSEANRKIVFDFFEDNLAAEAADHLRSKGLSDAAVHKAVREAYTNYGDKNYTERSAAMQTALIFYQFGKGMMRMFGKMAVQHPNYIEAPAQAARQTTEMQGEPQTSPRELVLGKTDHGQPITMSMPGALFGTGPTMIDLLFGAGLTGDPREPLRAGRKLAVSHLNPIYSSVAGIGEEGIPEPYNDITIDINAPNAVERMKDALRVQAVRYTPSPLRAVIEGWMEHNPYSVVGVVGPNIYLKMPRPLRAQVYQLQTDLTNLSRSPKYSPEIRDKAYEFAKELADGNLKAVAPADEYYRLVQGLRSKLPRGPSLVPKM